MYLLIDSQSNHLNKKIFFLSLLFSFFVFLSCVNNLNEINESQYKTRPELKKIQIGENILSVEIADEAQERLMGYSFRKGLKNEDGMLFVFPDSKKRAFHMKDMYFKLDIVFLDKNLRVINIEKNLSPCKKTPCELYYSKGNAMYVLEVPAGDSDKMNLNKDDQIKLIE